ncbi:MAG: M20/M25/M40 family metallo-hydrolase [Bryobacteraceae bacterium]|nr:M20/M25/M40 family metallo-hydrolase [Bryobacteraceae bacterium]
MSRLVTLLALAAIAANAADLNAVRKWRAANEHAILREFADLLAIPNIARDTANIRRNAALLTRMLERRGAQTRLLEVEGAPPVVYGEILVPGAKRTLLFYAHYDGQPVTPKDWTSDPWTPTLRSGSNNISWPEAGKPFDPEWRLYARSTSDDKGTIIAMMSALDALKAANQRPTSNIKFVFEGEEEAGSNSLAKILAKHKDLVQGDVWLICDGPVHQTRRQQLYFGARGVIAFDLTVYGPRRELHSGHYGNWAPNPAMALAQLLATLKDPSGKVTVEGFYDGIAPLTPSERAALASAPDNDDELRRELLIGETEGEGRKLIDLINQPSLNVRGLQSAGVGPEARNVVPATATASLDIRLVKGMDPDAAVNRVIEHIRRQGWHVVENEPDEKTRLAFPRVLRIRRDHGYRAVRSPMDTPIAKEIAAAVRAARGETILMPTLGGSVPLYVIEDGFNAPMVGVPIANHDNSQHGPNENIRLRNLWDGIETMAALFTM